MPKTEIPTTIVGYRGNRIDGREELSIDELATSFWSSTYADYETMLVRKVTVWLASSEEQGGRNLAIDWQDKENGNGAALDALLQAVVDRRPKKGENGDGL